MTALTAIIREKIRSEGPLDTGSFMSLALTHPEYGYYMRRDPLGREGDFVTAPEISQMFGELIGAWVADTWDKLGRPARFRLVECGPGRGTLMADTLRATSFIPGFHDTLSLVLLEASPSLRARQKEMLPDYDVEWCATLDDSPIKGGNEPLIIIANEFLDALPVRQLVFSGGAWKERVVALDDEDNLCFSAMPFDMNMAVPVEGQEADIFEFSPERDRFVADASALLAERGGAALFIDYGHAVHAAGDTLQAVRDHRYVPVLTDLGEADLTAHVDFASVRKIAEEKGLAVYGPVEQGHFLHQIGIGLRADSLMRTASAEQKENIYRAFHRLTAPGQMGKLFKVIALCHDPRIRLGGF